VTSSDSSSEQARSCAERWQEQLDWLDFWFQPEKAQMHDFDPGERDLFDALAPAWLAAEAGAGKIELLESMSERFGRGRVLALLGRMCANETRGYWSELARSEGGSLDDLVRLLWQPLLERGWEFSSEPRPNGIQFCVTHCPHAELGARLNAADWLSALVCAGDPYIAASFDPPLRFERTKTLMLGGDCCDHAYFVA
jgi:hypothetical protein